MLLIILAVICALGISVFQYLYKTKKEGQLKYWLSFFRFLTVFSILLLLINPSIERTELESIKPKLVVAVDNSSSIKLNSQEKSIQNFVGKIRNDKELNNKFSVDYYSFGKNLNKLDSLSFNEKQSNLSLPFKEFSKIYKNKSTPIILITDGNQTVGSDVEFTNYSSQVYPIIVGDTTITEDIYIHQLNVNENTHINNKFPVEIFLNYKGNGRITKRLVVYQNGKKVFNKPVDFSKLNSSKTESFFLTADRGGTQYFTAKIEEIEKEQNVINNSRTFSINVIEEKSEILILTSILHPDIGMLKKSIESNEQRSSTVSQISDFKGDISNYELVILYQPNEKFRSVFETISLKKKNYFVISGLKTDWNFLNNIQSNFSKAIISQSENYYPVFNSNYSVFLNNDIGFSNFSPLEDNFGEVTFSTLNKTLLFQKIGTIETERPLLATFEIENRRTAILLGENIWRWRMNSYTSNKTFELFDHFLSNLFQYLVSNSKVGRLHATVEPIYYANEPILFSASFLDENLNFNSKAKLWLTVSNKENSFFKKIPFANTGSKFSVELSEIPVGEYKYAISVKNESSKLSGVFKVIPFDVEQQFSNSNDEKLEILAHNTGGEINYLNDKNNDIINRLKSDEKFKSIQQSKSINTPLIDWKWILGFILVILTIEWFTRKYYGKI